MMNEWTKLVSKQKILPVKSSISTFAQGNKICHCFHFPPFICHEMVGPEAKILAFFFFNVEFQARFSLSSFSLIRLPRWLSSEVSTCQYKNCRRCGFDSWIEKIPWRRKWQATPVFLPVKSHRKRSLAGYSPWGPKELDRTKWLSTMSLLSRGS